VLARLQLAENNQRLVRCMYASDIASGREDRRHAPVSQTSGMLAASTNERDAGVGMRCVAGDTMYSAYAPCGQDSLSATSRRDEGTHALGEPEDLVALLPAPDRRPQNLRLRAVIALRRRRPDVRDGPRELDAEDLAHALQHCAPSAPLLSPSLHGEHTPGYTPLRCMMSIRFRPNARILTTTWPGRGAGHGSGCGAGRGASPRKSAPASPLPSRTSTAHIVWAEEDMIASECGVCGSDVRTGSCVYFYTIPRDRDRRQRRRG
jgi:hypothetical protein